VTITDAQIRTLRGSKTWNTLWLREFAIALGEITTVNHPISDRQAARRRCADLIFRRLP
jgi:hypothetical protein